MCALPPLAPVAVCTVTLQHARNCVARTFSGGAAPCDPLDRWQHSVWINANLSLLGTFASRTSSAQLAITSTQGWHRTWSLRHDFTIT